MRSRKLRKTLSCVLALTMAAGIFTGSAYAESAEYLTDGAVSQAAVISAEIADDTADMDNIKEELPESDAAEVEGSSPTLNGEAYNSFDELIKALPKLAKDGKLKAENTIELAMNTEAKKAVALPKGDYTFTLTGAKLTLTAPTITANSNLVLDCEVAAAKSGKTVTLKAAKDKTVKITKENVFGTISGAKGAKLVLDRSVTVDTIKTFESVDSGANMITLNKSMSAANIGTAFFSYTAATAKKVTVPAITGVFTVQITDLSASGTKLFTYSGKDALDRTKVDVFNTLDGKTLEAFVYKKEVRAEIPDLMKLNGFDCPSWEYAVLQMTEEKDYSITLTSGLELDKITMPKNAKSLTISGGDILKTITLKKGGSISVKYPIILENVEFTGAKAVNVKTAAKLTVNGTVAVNGTVTAAELASEKAGTNLTAQSLAVSKSGITAGSKQITLKLLDKKGNDVVFKEDAKKDVVVVKSFKGNYPDDAVVLDKHCGGFTLKFSSNKLVIGKTGGTDPTPPGPTPDTGKIINIWVWNEEFKEFFEKYMPGYDKSTKKLNGNKVVWHIVPSDSGEYRSKLNERLARNATASADDKIDLFLTEPYYIGNYTNSAYTLDLSSIGVTPASTMYDYTVELGKDSSGKFKAVSIYCCPSAIIYRRSLAKKAIGTDDPTKVQTALSTWEKFTEVAASAKLKEDAYMYASYEDTFRMFAKYQSEPWVTNGTLKIPSSVESWLTMTKNYFNKGYISESLPGFWGDEKNIQMSKYGNTMCFFGPAWYYNFCMGYALHPEKGSSGDWAICEGPQAYFWGGLQLFAAAGTDNATEVANIMKAFTTNESVCKNLMVNEKVMPNNTKVVASRANDSSYGNEFLGGQNDFTIMDKVAKDVHIKNDTIYDEYIIDRFPYIIQEYISGDITKDAAYNKFYDYFAELFPSITVP